MGFKLEIKYVTLEKSLQTSSGGAALETSQTFIWGLVGFHLISQCLLTEGNKLNITFHCQQSVAMTTSHRCHGKRVTLVEQHRLRYPAVLLLSSEASARPLSPRVRLPFCKTRETTGPRHQTQRETPRKD